MKKVIFLIVFVSIYLFNMNEIIAQKTDSDNLQNTALVIIDIQDFYFPGGLLPLVEPEKAALNAQKVLNAFRNKKMLVVHVRHNAKSGSEINKLVKPIEGEKVISKNKANAFVGTGLLNYLKDNHITKLVLCGMQTHMCLEATTRAASDLGFDCTVIANACATRDLKYGDITVKAKDVHYSTLSTLKGTYAKIETADEFIKSLK